MRGIVIIISLSLSILFGVCACYSPDILDHKLIVKNKTLSAGEYYLIYNDTTDYSGIGLQKVSVDVYKKIKPGDVYSVMKNSCMFYIWIIAAIISFFFFCVAADALEFFGSIIENVL